MKRKGLYGKCAVLFAVVLTLSNIGVLPAEAGASTIVVDNTSFLGEIDDTSWSNPDSLVTVENDALVFTESSTADTRLITRTAVRESEVEDELVNASVTICPKKMPSEEKFIFALGLSSIEALPGESGNVEVQFVNDGGIKVSVIAYGDEGAQEVISSKSAGKLGTSIRVDVTITTSGQLTLKLAGKTVGKGKLPVSGEGRIGFLQTGFCAVKISNVRFESYRYETPENSNFFEDFENGSMNQSYLTSMMIGFPAQYLPCYARIEEYEGNQVFFCNNSGGTYIGTQQEYSNFELTFDVPYIQTETVWDESGEALKLVCGEIFLGWGYEDANPTGAGDYLLADQSISIRSGTQLLPKGYSELNCTPETHRFFSAGCDRGASVKLSVVDATATLSLKWIDEDEWTEVLTYQTGTQTPLGYVQLWVMTPGNLAVDNIKIVNKDLNPKLVTLEDKYERLERVEDYKYEETEVVYKDFTVQEEVFNWYLLIPITAAACVVVIGIVFGITKVKNRKKGGSNDA